jgi:hemolysin activation/secretion protein
VAALGGLDRALLVRGRAAAVRRLGAAAVPFEELVLASGPFWMRGFPEGRFRGESGILATAEYRWYVAARLDASLFADLGTVAGPAFAGLRGDRWFPSFGAGLRLFSLDGAHWEGDLDTGVQLAYAPDGGFRFLFTAAGF